MSKFTKALEIIGVSPKENQDSFEDDYFEDDFKDDAEEIKAYTGFYERCGFCAGMPGNKDLQGYISVCIK